MYESLISLNQLSAIAEEFGLVASVFCHFLSAIGKKLTLLRTGVLTKVFGLNLRACR